jgi:hypothetical protein
VCTYQTTKQMKYLPNPPFLFRLLFNKVTVGLRKLCKQFILDPLNITVDQASELLETVFGRPVINALQDELQGYPFSSSFTYLYIYKSFLRS